MRLFDKYIYVRRRSQLCKDVKEGIIILPGNDEAPMNYADNTYPFRQDSTFLYFFGIPKPGLVGIIDTENGESYLFGDDPTLDEIVWTGPQESIGSFQERIGANSSFTLKKLKDFISKARASNRKIHVIPPYREEHRALIASVLDINMGDIQKIISRELIESVVKQRIIKSDEELIEIEVAVNITGEMHKAAMKMTRVGIKEQHIVSKLLEISTSYGGFYSFPPIVTKHGETLHNHYYGNVLEKGDLLLCDAGAETDMGYAGDLTRTFPVGQGFTEIQKDVYTIVLNAHHAAVNALKPGIAFKDVHLLACLTLSEGLKDMGLMKGNMADAVEAGAHAMFFQCGLGHLMGLDVHDMENLGETFVGYEADMEKSSQFGLKSLRLGRELKPGYVLTVEPGLYFIPSLIDLWKAENKFSDYLNYNALEKFRDFGGMRVEEDFVITENGSRLLGEEIPKTIKEIEIFRSDN